MPAPRERILDAAGDIFGRKGFKAATVREICRKAGVNLAAVNYYFRDKTALYNETVRNVLQAAFERYPVDSGLSPDAGPEERLQAFIHAFLLRLLTVEGLAGAPGKGQLMARELADPSPVLDDLVRDHIRPHVIILTDIVAAIMGRKPPPEELMPCLFSIIGQCFYYAFARPVVTRLLPLDLSRRETIEQLAGHITRFSLGGLQAAEQGRTEGRHQNPEASE